MATSTQQRLTTAAVSNSEPTFKVPFGATKFPPGSVAASGTLEFTANDLAHALFATGRAPGDQFRYGKASVYEYMHRVSVIPAYVRRAPYGVLRRSRLALELDRSEKMAFSYALGQAMTAIFCGQLLGATHLMHVDRYGHHYGMTFGVGKTRADLFGPALSGWLVAEAKGRSRQMESALRSKLIKQKRSVKSIGGQSPSIALGCVASFPPDAAGMRVDAVDPVEDEPEAITIDADLDSYVEAYYAPIIAMTADSAIGAEGRYAATRMPGVGVTVGLNQRLLRLLQEERRPDGGLYERVLTVLDDEAPRSEGEYPDGTMFRTAWQDQLALDDWSPEDGAPLG